MSSRESPNGQNFGNGITGTSDELTDITGALARRYDAAYRLRYWTDGAAGGEGIAVGGVEESARPTTR